MQKRANIIGIDYALPERVVTNAELAQKHPTWDIERVAAKTGVYERRFCGPNETASDLGLRAAEKIISRTGVASETIDGLILCTQTPDYLLPATTCSIQERLKLPTSVLAFDFTHACSGFVYGLVMARAFIESGTLKNILLITADSYSKCIDPEDRATVSLFGDGAAATLIQRSESPDKGIGPFELGTDGSGLQTFFVPRGGSRTPREATFAPFISKSGQAHSPDHIYMDGPGVYAFVQRRVATNVAAVLQKAETALADIDLVIFHQASAVSLDYLKRKLALPEEKTFSNIRNIGNTVSASIPIALRDAELAGKLHPGMRVLLVAFGAGLSWGSCIVDWTSTR